MKFTVINKRNVPMEIKSYSDYKQVLKTELNNTALSFVRIGYLLKQARDTDILKESGYSSMEEFAKSEFGLDKSQVSRFININDRFSIDGNSEFIDAKYKDFGVAKLGVMLTLSDEVVDQLSPELTRSQIVTVQKEIQAEKEIGGTELLLEGTDENQDKYKEIISKAIYEFYHTHPNEYVKICNIVQWNKEDVIQAFCPMGVIAETVRLQGIGRILISVKDLEHNITFTNVRSNETEECSWEYLIDVIFQVCMCHSEVAGRNLEAEKAWEAIYQEEFPKPEPKPEPQPQPQPKKEQPKTETKKAEPEKNTTVAPVQPKTVPAKALEEKAEEPKVTVAAVVEPTPKELYEQQSEEPQEVIINHTTGDADLDKIKVEVMDNVKSLMQQLCQNNWKEALKLSKSVTITIEQIMENEGK